MNGVPLHVHSMYSALDGFSTPEEIADRCVEIGCPCCGITDHGLVAGHLHFAKAMESRGIKPIFGCELYHGVNTSNVFKAKERDQAHLIALAMTNEGLRNLWRLVNRTAQEDRFHNVGRVFWEDIENHHEGLVFTSACALSLVNKELLQDKYDALNRYLSILGDDFYIEIHTYPGDKPFNDRDADREVNMRVINETLVGIAQERGIPMVYADDAHRAKPDQYWAHDAYVALQTGDTIFTPPEERKMWHPEEALVIHDEESVRKALDYLPGAVVDECIANSQALAERATATLPEVRRHLPMFVPGDCPWISDMEKKYREDTNTLTAEDLFVDLVVAGIKERYSGPESEPSDEVWNRTFYEMETLLRDGIHHYFLMGWDEIQAAKNMNIPIGPGRGSSAGCIVAYALGITDVDPLHYGLIFERFWNSGRAKGFPDIDSDFSRARRQELIEYLKDRWGRDKVCAIGTVGYMKPKSTIDKLGRGCGIDFKEAEALKEIVGRTTKIDILGHEQIGWTRELEPGKKYYVKEEVGEEIEKWIRSQPAGRRWALAQFIELCEVCCSRVQQYGIHASGIVISDVPLADELPAYRRGGKGGVPATQFPMTAVDDRMFIKLDVLGLRTLDAIGYWDEMMKEVGIETEWSGLDREEHEPEMWDMLRDKYTAAIFQVEDGYGRQLCQSMDPRSVGEFAVLGAINRPGPIQAKIPDHYVARKNGEEPVSYPDPRLEEILGDILQETYGLFVYQEQIIAYFNAIGYTLSESDAMRKIMGKKLPEQLDDVRDGEGEWKGRGYLDMAEKAGIPRYIAQDVWEEIEGFADYCFNKSHAVAYAIIGFRTLYAKYWAPAHAYAASMWSLDPSSDGEKRKNLIPEYVNECRRMGIEVRPPDIRYAKGHAYVDPMGRLLFGFGDVRNVANSGNYIVDLRDNHHLDISSPERFIAAFEEYNEEFLKEKKEKVKSGEWTKKVKSPKQQLRINQIESLEQAGAWDDMHVREISLTKRQKNEEEMLGVIVTDNSAEVLKRNADQIAECDDWFDMLTPFAEKPEWQEDEDGDREYFTYRVCGIVSNIQEKRSKKTGKAFGIVTVESDDNSVEMMVWNSKLVNFKRLFKIRTVGIFTIKHIPAVDDYSEGYFYEKGMVLR